MSPWEYQEIRRCSATARVSSPGWNELRRVLPRLGQAFHNARREAGLSLAELYVQGRDHEHLYQLAEALIELDEQAQLWRMRHYQIVARVIGDSVVGTQGTPPVELLSGRLDEDVVPRALGSAQRADRALKANTVVPEESRASAGAAPPRHGQPTGERDEGGGAAPRLPRRERRRGGALRASARAGEPRCANRRSRRAVALVFLCHTGHGSRGSAEWEARSVVRRPRGRRGVGARRPRHEGPGGGECGRVRIPCARGIRAVRRPPLHRGRRGSRRRGRATATD